MERQLNRELSFYAVLFIAIFLSVRYNRSKEPVLKFLRRCDTMKLYIGENLKKLRMKKNVTQEMVAEYLGVTYQAVSRWENGAAYPDIELLPELARYFAVSLEELMGTEGDKERVRKTIEECWMLEDRAEALARIRKLEREYPNNWWVKLEICYLLCDSEYSSTDEILPELRQYAFAARDAMKDYWVLKYFAFLMVKAVPEEEVNEWLEYLPSSSWMTQNHILRDRYSQRNDTEKARQYQSKNILDYTEELTHIPNLDGTPESNLQSSACVIRLLDAVVGEPYKKNGIVHNSLLLHRRVRAQFWLACGYAGTGQTEAGMEALEKGVDACLLYQDALQDETFGSDYPYLKPQKNTVDEPTALLDWCIGAFDAPHGWEWLDSLRTDTRFADLHRRLSARKAEIASAAK